jgi:SAM-dependent methyltransferase
MTEPGWTTRQMGEGGTFTDRAVEYYAGKLKAHGATYRGVDWNSVESQERRFAELLRICEGEPAVSVNDFGCGYGALVNYLLRTGRPFDYCGYDASPAMIDAARARLPNVPACTFTPDRASVAPRDYTVASGVFNVKLDAMVPDWWAYVTRELDAMAAMSRRGFAFNMLTGYADPDRKRDDLFYPEPEAVFRHCMDRFSHSVALSHDYPLYEFTVLVRL